MVGHVCERNVLKQILELENFLLKQIYSERRLNTAMVGFEGGLFTATPAANVSKSEFSSSSYKIGALGLKQRTDGTIWFMQRRTFYPIKIICATGIQKYNLWFHSRSISLFYKHVFQ